MLAHKQYCKLLAAQKRSDETNSFVDGMLRFLTSPVGFFFFFHVLAVLTPELRVKFSKKDQNAGNTTNQ